MKSGQVLEQQTVYDCTIIRDLRVRRSEINYCIHKGMLSLTMAPKNIFQTNISILCGEHAKKNVPFELNFC